MGNSNACNDSIVSNSGLIVSEHTPDQLCDNSYGSNISNSTKLDLLSLNVCGVTSKLKYKNLHELMFKFNIICFSEIRTSHISSDEFPGYKVIISDKKCKKDGVEVDRLTGIAVLLRENIGINYEILKNTNCEWVLWTKIVFQDNFSFLLGSVYIPNGSSIYYCDTIYDALSEDILDLITRFDLPIILSGDFNSRTGTLCDTLRYEKKYQPQVLLTSKLTTLYSLICCNAIVMIKL